MRLNNSFLVYEWVKTNELKDYFLQTQANRKLIEDAGVHVTDHEMLLRIATAKFITLTYPNQKIFYLTKSAQEEAAKLVKGKTIQMKWFKNMPDMDGIYVTGKDEFYRYLIRDKKLYILFFFNTPDGVLYQSSWVDINDGELNLNSWQNPEIFDRFMNLILFMELTKKVLEITQVKDKQKVKYGKGGDDKLLNELGINNVYLVNKNHNKTVIRIGEFPVSEHYRIQAVGKGRKEYTAVYIAEYVKGGYNYRGKEQRSA